MTRGGIRAAARRHIRRASGPSELSAELWSFALSFYEREGVSQACLLLQERIDADVDIILFAVFVLVERGISLEGEELRAVDGFVEGWRAEIVRPLRHIRNRLKSGPRPAPSEITGKLRERIKAIEIEAERVELDMLATWLAEAGDRPTATAHDAAALLARLARYFAGARSGLPEEPEIGRALRILELAAREAAGEKWRRSRTERDP